VLPGRFRLRRAAEEDLLDIATYTVERWGEDQAREYIGQLDRPFRELAANPEHGKPANDVRPGYLRQHLGRHMIYYRRMGGGIEIVRILHDRMSPKRHL
jgi:toxin ParE1/3/4